jgi:hypothetical protein
MCVKGIDLVYGRVFVCYGYRKCTVVYMCVRGIESVQSCICVLGV